MFRILAERRDPEVCKISQTQPHSIATKNTYLELEPLCSTAWSHRKWQRSHQPRLDHAANNTQSIKSNTPTPTNTPSPKLDHPTPYNTIPNSPNLTLDIHITSVLQLHICARTRLRCLNGRINWNIAAETRVECTLPFKDATKTNKKPKRTDRGKSTKQQRNDSDEMVGRAFRQNRSAKQVRRRYSDTTLGNTGSNVRKNNPVAGM